MQSKKDTDTNDTPLATLKKNPKKMKKRLDKSVCVWYSYNVS